MKINELRKLIRDILSEINIPTPRSVRVAGRVDHPPPEIPDETRPRAQWRVDQKLAQQKGEFGSEPVGLGGRRPPLRPDAAWATHVNRREAQDAAAERDGATRLKAAIAGLNPNNKEEIEGAKTIADIDSNADTVAPGSRAVTQKENKMTINELRNIIKEIDEEEKKKKAAQRKTMKQRVEDDCRKIIRLVNDGDVETAKGLVKRLYQMLDR